MKRGGAICLHPATRQKEIPKFGEGGDIISEDLLTTKVEILNTGDPKEKIGKSSIVPCQRTARYT